VKLFTGYRPDPRPEYIAAGLTNKGESADYQGVVFDDGTVVLRWLTDYRSHSVWRNYQDFYEVHGHPEYGTKVLFTMMDYEQFSSTTDIDEATDF
jgi:hypothetical protein